jgi:hypothetical protein
LGEVVEAVEVEVEWVLVVDDKEKVAAVRLYSTAALPSIRMGMSAAADVVAAVPGW